MTTPRLSLRERIDAKCKACVYDRLAAGTWREQVADCGSVSCELYDVRPVPRDAMRNGRPDPARMAEIHAKLNPSSVAA